MERHSESFERKKVVPPGIYSDQLQGADSVYEVGSYDEVGGSTFDRPMFSEISPSVVGREYDTEEHIRREYFVDKEGKIFEVKEFGAYPFKDDRKEISRTVYKDGSGKIIAVEAHVITKGEHLLKTTFWEWNADEDSGEWDRTKLEEDESFN